MIVKRVSYFTFIVAITTLASVSACSQAKAMAVNAVNGAEEAFEYSVADDAPGISICTTELARTLQGKGLKAGRFKITKDISGNKNAVKIYLVINKDYKGQVSARIFDSERREVNHTIKSFDNKSQQAIYVPAAGFSLDKRTDIKCKNRILLE